MASFLPPPNSSRSDIVLSAIQLNSAGLGVLSLWRAPNLGMSGVPRPLMPTSPLESTSALEPPPLFSHPLASAVRPPRQLTPTVGQLEELAGSMLRTEPFSYADESIALADDVVGALVASFAALRISDAFTTDEYPSKVLSYSDSPLSLSGGVSAGAMDVHVEVFVTGDGASSSSSKTRKAAEARATAERTEPFDPLRAAMQSLRIPIGTDVDATNVAEARTQLEERRQQMLDLSETLAATQRRLDAAQLERDAAYGFTPAAAKPSQAGSLMCVPGEE